MKIYKIKIRKKYSLLPLWSLLLIFLLIQLAFPQINKIDKIMNMIYPGAYDIQKKPLDEKGFQYIYYKAKEDYPSLKVYEFYSNILKSEKYQEIHWERQNFGKWFSFIDDTGSKSLVVHELRAAWTDKKKEEMFFLSLRYYSKSDRKRNGPDNNVLHVSFQKRPYMSLQ
jgi:hypothetical protein